MVRVLKVITVHVLVRAATWNVVAFPVMRLWICRVSIDAMVCFCALITSIPPSSYGFISMQISMNVHKAKVCATTVLALTPMDPFFVYVQLVMSLILKPGDV